nr:hypothetical protein [Arthrobacter sp. Bi26]
MNIHEDIPGDRTHQDVQATAAFASNDEEHGMRAGPDQGRRRVPAALQHRVNPQSGMVLGQTGDGFSQNRAGIRGHSVSSGACWPAAGFFLTVADMDHHQVLAKAERFRGGPFHSDGRVRGPVGADDNTGPVFIAGRGHDRHHAVADGGRLKTDRPEALTVPVRAPVGSYTTMSESPESRRRVLAVSPVPRVVLTGTAGSSADTRWASAASSSAARFMAS